MTENSIIDILNQVFDLQKKIDLLPENRKYMRNIDRICSSLENEGYKFHNPIGETYTETRTDLEAEISGDSMDNLAVNEVIKPIIYKTREGKISIIQRAMVIVSGKK